jgi:hypothetical protein
MEPSSGPVRMVALGLGVVAVTLGVVSPWAASRRLCAIWVVALWWPMWSATALGVGRAR